MPVNHNWIRLNNAATIYPAAMSKRWKAVFRLSATLKEPVDEEILAQALARTVRRIPSFSLRLGKGLFWHYLEEVEGSPPVEPDVINPCTCIDLRGESGFMFRVRVHERRIALEIFHVLADGTGGMIFLKTLLAEYLSIRYGEVIPRSAEILDCDGEPSPEESEDAFKRFARPVTIPRAESGSYRVRGTPGEEDYPSIVTGLLSASAVREQAKKYGVTVTEYLVAALVMSIAELQKSEISRRRRRQKIKICTPVNLRKFYPSRTLRNFSSFINPGINPVLGEYTFEEAAKRIKHLMGLDASEKMINARMSRNVADERMAIIRFAPLFLKNSVLKYAFWKNGDRVSSSTLSNLGVVKLPEEMRRHVERFDFILGPLLYNPNACACVTFGDTLCINFTRTIRESLIERRFFTFLVREGLHVTVESDRRY